MYEDTASNNHTAYINLLKNRDYSIINQKNFMGELFVMNKGKCLERN